MEPAAPAAAASADDHGALVTVLRGVKGTNGSNDLIVTRPLGGATGSVVVVAFAGDMSAYTEDMLASNRPVVPPWAAYSWEGIAVKLERKFPSAAAVQITTLPTLIERHAEIPVPSAIAVWHCSFLL